MDKWDVICLWLVFVLAFCLRYLLGLLFGDHSANTPHMYSRAAELRVRIGGLR